MSQLEARRPLTEAVRCTPAPTLSEADAAWSNPDDGLKGSFAVPFSCPVRGQGVTRCRVYLRMAMRMRGLEPPRAFAHTDLNRARLPIPPHPRGGRIVAADRHRVAASCVPWPPASSRPRPRCGPRLARAALRAGAAAQPAAPARPGSSRSSSRCRSRRSPRRSSATACSQRRRRPQHRLNLRAPASVSLPPHARRPRSARCGPRSSQRSRARASAGATASSSTGWPSSCRARSSPARSACPARPSGRRVTYHELARPHAAADRRAHALGPDARDRGPRDEDRDHRRRHRPDAPVLRPDRLHVSRRASRRGTPRSRRRR